MVQEHGGESETILPFSYAFEQKLVDMPERKVANYCAENQLTRQVNFYKDNLTSLHTKILFLLFMEFEQFTFKF